MSSINFDLFNQLLFNAREMDAVKSYVLGGPGVEVVTAACCRLLGNPTWLVGRLATDPENIKALTDFIRIGGSDILNNLQLGLARMREFNQTQQSNIETQQKNIQAIPDVASRNELTEYLEQQDRRIKNMMKLNARNREKQILISVLERHQNNKRYRGHSLQELHIKFPGIASTVAAGVQIMNKALQTPDKDTLLASDFGDVMHAFYALYVDIFRADRFMADGLRKSLAHTRTTIVSKLSELPALIKARLRSR